jgi:chloramphenicol 3-O-phosphotransferase
MLLFFRFMLSFICCIPYACIMACDEKEPLPDGVPPLSILMSFPKTETDSSINMQYEYDDADIHNLLLLRLQEEGIGLSGEVVLMPPLENSGNQIVQQLCKEREPYRERLLSGESFSAERIILVPINLNNFHWVGLAIKLDARNDPVRVQYIDSLAGDISVEIGNFIKDVYGKSVYIDSPVILRQIDDASSGVLTVENLVRAAQNICFYEIADGELIGQIRFLHANLLRRFMPEVRFDLKQAMGIDSWRLGKLLERSYRWQKRDMSLYFFKKGKVVLVLGMSSAGKSSLVNCITSEYKEDDLVVTGSDAILKEVGDYVKDYDDLLRMAHKFCNSFMVENLDQGKTIVGDVVAAFPFLYALERNFIRCRVYIVAMYCSPRVLSDRIMNRNRISIAGSMDDIRLFFPFHQYQEMYEPTYSGLNGKIVVEKEDFMGVDFFNECRELFKGCKISEEVRDNVLQVLQGKEEFQRPYLRKILSWFESVGRSKVHLVPRGHVDFLIDTTRMSPRQILGLLGPLFGLNDFNYL